jgi:ornithine carbamoyltransferase
MKHFLQENDFSPPEIKEIFTHAFAYKANRAQRPTNDLYGQTWGMLFHKKSTRTRVSFEVGIRELGGNPLILDQSSTQIGRGESVEDTTKVLSRFLDGLIIRTHGHEIIEGFASHSSIPVINALTDFLHPCQIFADCMTLLEKTGDSQDPFSLAGKKLTFFGDTQCNMANSWIIASALFGLEVCLSGPADLLPKEKIIQYLEKHDLQGRFEHQSDPALAALDADVLYTDVWVSMGFEEEADERKRIMSPYQVTEAILQSAKPEAHFMHCMPTHPGEEVSESVLASPQAILFDQAENRLHIQKAILRQLNKS